MPAVVSSKVTSGRDVCVAHVRDAHAIGLRCLRSTTSRNDMIFFTRSVFAKGGGEAQVSCDPPIPRDWCERSQADERLWTRDASLKKYVS